MYRSQPSRDTRKANPYLSQKVFSASPEQLVAYIMDYAVAACIREDKVKATESIHLLINSLKYDHKEVAMTFYRGYNLILEHIFANRFEQARMLISELRDHWKEAMHLD